MLGIGFLNTALLAGGVLIASPIVLHLLSRRRQRRVPWAAMFLIEEVVRADRRRIELRRWILLALRCLALLLLALAAARPTLTSFRTGGAGDGDAIYVVDDSASMGIRDAADTPGERADLFVERASSRGQRRPLVLRERDLAGAAAKAFDLLGDAGGEVVILSDFRGDAPPLPAAPDGVVMSLVPLATPVADAASVGLVGVAAFPSVAVAERPMRVTATLRNYGSSAATDVLVELVSDADVVLSSRLVSIDAGTTLDVALPFVPAEAAASLRVNVVIANDLLPADDAATVRIDPLAAVSVLLIEPPDRPADLLAIALDPTPADDSTGGPLRVRRVAPNDLTPALLREADVVVFADTGPLTPLLRDDLRAWTERGAAAFWFAGAAATSEANDELWPATIADLSDTPTNPAAPPYAHPALGPWNDAAEDALADVAIRRRWALELRDDATTVLPTINGEPLIAQHRRGDGIATLVAFPASGEWSNLPQTPSFLPLVQQLVTTAVATISPTVTVELGAPPGEGRIDVPDDAALAAESGASVARTVEALERQRLERRDGREVWRLVWLAIVVILFAELVVAGGPLGGRGGR